MSQKLSDCCVCKGNIWSDDDSIYQMQPEKEHLFEAPYHQVMNLPYKWEKSWLGKYKDIVFIKICDRCFCASAINDEIFTFEDVTFGGTKDYVYGKISNNIGRDSVKHLIKQDFDYLEDKMRRYGVEKKNNKQQDAVLELLSKIKEQKDKYRDIVKGLALKEKKDEENRLKEFNESNIRELARIEALEKSIIDLLKEKAVKMPASDIDAFLKHQNVDEIKELCEEMYHNGEISRTANYRYFILSEEKKKPKKASAPKSEAVDVKAELKKYKEMLDEGLIDKEDYEAKKDKLLGI